MVDDIELLQDTQGRFKNLNLTYAVRDGIISHCGEVNQALLRPREEAIDLHKFSKYTRFEPYTWEGCVMKIADKIAYLGRDLEDAQRLGILSKEQLDELEHILLGFPHVEAANNTNFIHIFITDLCRHSSPETGLCFSPEIYELMKLLMRFNYKHIYKHPRLKNYEKYAKLVIEALYEALAQTFYGSQSLLAVEKNFIPVYPKLGGAFLHWIRLLAKTDEAGNAEISHHKRIYDLHEEKDYNRAVIDFLSLLTDRAAIEYFDELTSF